MNQTHFQRSSFHRTTKPLSIVNDTKEFTNSLDSPIKPSSPVAKKSQFTSDFYEDLKVDEVKSVKSLASPDSKKKKLNHSPSKFYRPGALSNKDSSSSSISSEDKIDDQSQCSEQEEGRLLLQELKKSVK